MAIDYSNYETNKTFYNGSDKKIGINIQGEKYMIKFRKKEGQNKHFNHISEYLGSHIFSILGIKSQEAYLGYYKGEEVVLIKDFNEEGSFFVPFDELSDLLLDEEDFSFEYSFEDVIKFIKDNNKIENKEKIIDTLWEVYIVDALIANSDRHGNNWGFIKKNNKHSLAPIFDNDYSLFPKLTDENRIKEILESEEELNRKVYEIPLSPIKLDGKNSLYYDVISSLRYKECNKALKRIVERIDLDKIYTLIDNVEFASNIRKDFYKKIIKERYEKILLASYVRLVGENNE